MVMAWGDIQSYVQWQETQTIDSKKLRIQDVYCHGARWNQSDSLVLSKT